MNKYKPSTLEFNSKANKGYILSHYSLVKIVVKAEQQFGLKYVFKLEPIIVDKSNKNHDEKVPT